MTSNGPNSIALISLAAASLLVLSISVSLYGCVRHSVDQSTLDHEFLEAVARGDPDSVRQSLKRGSHIEAKDHNGYTALLIIAHQEQRLEDKAKSQTAIVKMMLENGANMEVRDQNGATPLRVTVQNGDPAVIKLLLDKGANVEAKDQNGETALMEAARLGRSDVTEILPERTADREAKNRALLAAIVPAPVVIHISQPQPSIKAGCSRLAQPDLESTLRRYSYHKAAARKRTKHRNQG